MLRNREQTFQVGANSRIKFVELSGVKHKEYFKSADPYARNCSPEEGCFVCKDAASKPDQRSAAPPTVNNHYHDHDMDMDSNPTSMFNQDQRSTAPPLSKLSHCKTSNVGYSITCKLCRHRGKHISYEGETGRNAFIRGKEHKRALENKSKSSIL